MLGINYVFSLADAKWSNGSELHTHTSSCAIEAKQGAVDE
jgi:hypothetical protein